MSRYNLIFQGSIADGYRPDQVKRNLAKLLKADENKVESLFTKGSVVLKKDLNHESAVKYRDALLKAGAVCNIKSAAGSGGALPVETAAPPSAAAQALAQSAPPPLPDQTYDKDLTDTRDARVEKTDTEVSQNNKNGAVKDILAGGVLIGIGFLFGGSVFLGNPGILDYFFDGLGVFWIAKGIYRMIR
jgi:hypothetical protein